MQRGRGRGQGHARGRVGYTNFRYKLQSTPQNRRIYCGDSSFIVTINNTGNEILIFPLCFAHSARYLQVSGLFGCFFSSAEGRG